MLRADVDELGSAMEGSSSDHTHYLDLGTGEILSIADCTDDETEELKEDIDENPDRYEVVPRTEAYEGYRDIEDFIATVQDERLFELLEVAIDGKGAFRRFKSM